MPNSAYPGPRLRPMLDIQPVNQVGKRYYYLRDPLGFCTQLVLVPASLGPVLMLLDGKTPAADLRGLAAIRHGLFLGKHQVDELLDALDTALLLENGRFAAAWQSAEQAYRSAPYRFLSCAPGVYPADAPELQRQLDEYLQAAQSMPPLMPLPAAETVRGLLSPHIDYARGGLVYAQVWAAAAAAARQADLAIIFGTDHYSGGQTLTLTRQQYATPYGVLPNPLDITESLLAELGPLALAGELRQRSEHSVELAAAWLHHLRGGAALEMLPVLTGSLGQAGEIAPEIETLLEILAEHIRGRRVLVVAAGDLAHVGPAFGGAPLDAAGKAAIRDADDELLAHMQVGDAGGFLNAIQRVDDCNNVCGVSPIYLTLRLLAPGSGHLVAYGQCPADQANTSIVSVAGMLFT